MIETRDLAVTMGRARILSGVDFAAKAGAVTAVVGPNGSGKTTLLRALSGDVAHTGTVTINGRALAALKPWQAAALRAVLPQHTPLAFPFTVGEVVRLGLTGGDAGAAGAALPERALARVDLAGYAGRLYQELSGGEQQRVQLARVLCQVWQPVAGGAPRWLLLDEPVSSLDMRHQLLVMRIAADFAAAGGGVVAVLHDLNLAAMFAGHIVMMKQGAPAAAGPPRTVLCDAVLARVFDCPLAVGRVPDDGTPFVLPQAAG
ncbi:heme ABC transporter ATP-binding protein [Aquibium sp. A9E412]|uniref:heme ABC transporter ATP-binding protein n=1 Tax=Aquibium sp. A9E412 TaxID=2976767 RepID=UPI0025AEE401|nr:heme ABC transporter ATP-binding protein [Aquibium sp. A9E412]MDN2566942.1 heme ABC transporter ATP-binding protein [Aquibium sp. A9E412]